jgi:hypothetical protein
MRRRSGGAGHPAISAHGSKSSAGSAGTVTRERDAARGREDIAHRIARVAAKRRYHKVGDEWVPLGEQGARNHKWPR